MEISKRTLYTASICHFTQTVALSSTDPPMPRSYLRGKQLNAFLSKAFLNATFLTFELLNSSIESLSHTLSLFFSKNFSAWPLRYQSPSSLKVNHWRWHLMTSLCVSAPALFGAHSLIVGLNSPQGVSQSINSWTKALFKLTRGRNLKLGSDSPLW